MTIPKIIHYCWFGDNEIPELEMRCIASWTKVLSDYQIMFWNEKTFDINSVPYVKQAYEHRKFAFVSDYVRVYALFTYGGIYFDTDVEVLKSFDAFLNNDGFIGFENKTSVGTGIIGACKNSIIMEQMLKYYHNHNFADDKGNIDVTTNVQILMNFLIMRNFIKENKEQCLDGIHIYARDVFCPKKLEDGTFRLSDKTTSLHYFSGSWLTDRERKRGNNIIWRAVARPILKKIRSGLIKTIGEKRGKSIEIIIRNKIK